MNPTSVILSYSIIAPMLLAFCFMLWMLFCQDTRITVLVTFPNIIASGRVNDSGSEIDIPGNGALFLAGKKLQPGATIHLVQV